MPGRRTKPTKYQQWKIAIYNTEQMLTFFKPEENCNRDD